MITAMDNIPILLSGYTESIYRSIFSKLYAHSAPTNHDLNRPRIQPLHDPIAYQTGQNMRSAYYINLRNNINNLIHTQARRLFGHNGVNLVSRILTACRSFMVLALRDLIGMIGKRLTRMMNYFYTGKYMPGEVTESGSRGSIMEGVSFTLTADFFWISQFPK